MPKTIYLSPNNRITRVFRKNDTGDISVIVCVSLDCFINENWHTIIYYDSVHGELHRHEKFSLDGKTETITTFGIEQKGSQEMLMRWAIRDISDKHTSYKRRFLKNIGCNKVEVLYNLY